MSSSLGFPCEPNSCHRIDYFFTFEKNDQSKNEVNSGGYLPGREAAR